MCGIAPEDDDGAEAHRSEPQPQRKQEPPADPEATNARRLVREYLERNPTLTWADVAAAAEVPEKPDASHWKPLTDWLVKALVADDKAAACEVCYGKDGNHADDCPEA
jgi:hypothetical protein